MGDISKNFNRSEFACKGEHCNCTPIAVDAELVNVLQKLRDHTEQPITITSAYRCENHNAAVGGVPSSKHRLGIAADIQVKNFTPHDIAMYLRNEYPDKYGIGEYSTFVHIDTRSGCARWTG
jgi:uncharacterized protein YcbK (DUF882 family)